MSHEHHHHEGSPHLQIARIVCAAVLLAGAMIVEHTCTLPAWQLLLVYLVPYLLAGFGTLAEAVRGVWHGEAMNEHFLMAVATGGALAIGFMPGAETEFAEAVFVMLFYQVGELFEGYAEGQSRRSIARLTAIRPDTAQVERSGEILSVRAEDVAVGETVVVNPGSRVPLDGVITEGHTTLDTSALTGESMPRSAEEGDEVPSGCVNLSGTVRLRTLKPFAESTASKIIRLVEDASGRKSRSEAFITRFARIYTPAVVFAALALALLPPLFSGQFLDNLPVWLHRALIFLVVSCPCALVIGIPLTFFGGIGGASKLGILIKGGNFMDTLAEVRTVVFDKTGTLTQGRFAVTAVHPDRYDEDTILHLAAHVERHSAHPVAAALRDAFPAESTDGCTVTDLQETAGQGVTALVEGVRVTVGNTKMMEAAGLAWHECPLTGTIVHVGVAGEYAGHIVINDQMKPGSREAVEALKKAGVNRIAMLTGDRKASAQEVANALGIDTFRAELLPGDKLACVEEMMGENSTGGTLAFVGDGINDAPVLARADVGVAMGALGTDAAVDAADVVLADDNPVKVATAIALSRRTLGIARQNTALALGVKGGVLALAAIGLATMWMAVFADVGVTVLAVFNAMLTLNVSKYKN
ncbi:MAG: cadmium-translocating P-type ATPase [Bacteroidaceae bacterium]|nr:cadmium-translocating P-type ATPase [Bacteroidaceae bacterium]